MSDANVNHEEDATTNDPNEPISSDGHELLKEQFSQQQAKITALKELVRQTEASQGKRTANAAEKAKSIAQRLTHLKSSKSARAGKQQQLQLQHGQEKSFTEPLPEETSVCSSPPTSPIVRDLPGTDAAENASTSAAEATYSSSAEESTKSFQRADSLPAHTATTPNLSASAAELAGSEKIQLLRRQMEANRARMAEREHSKRDIEQLVQQLRSKFDSSQLSLDRSHSQLNLGRSVGDLSLDHSNSGQQQHSKLRQSAHRHSITSNRPAHGRGTFQSSADLAADQPHNFDRERIRYLEQRCAHLEQQQQQQQVQQPPPMSTETAALQAEIIDLREQLREKDSLIEARTQAVGVVSEMGRSAEDELHETRGEWRESQARFADAEQHLVAQLADRDEQIASLLEANEILEKARFELTVQRAQESDAGGEGGHGHEEFAAKLGELLRLNEALQRNIGELELRDSQQQEKLEALEAELRQKNEQCAQLEQTLEARVPNAAISTRVEDDDQSDSSSIELRTIEQLTQRVDELSALVTELRQENGELSVARADNERLSGELHEQRVECDVLQANLAVLHEKLKSAAPRSLFSAGLGSGTPSEAGTAAAAAADDDELSARLKRQLDEANKSAIKTKLKLRQLQKQVDTMRRTDDQAARIGELHDEADALRGRVRELEDELAAPRLSNIAPDMATTCHDQLEAIRLLEEQKQELSAELGNARAEITQLRTAAESADELDRSEQVSTHMEAIQLELRLGESRAHSAELQTKLAAMQAERTALAERLGAARAENAELLERWDRRQQGSSAESIEIVENLTASERLEMERIERAAAGKGNNESGEALAETAAKTTVAEGVQSIASASDDEQQHDNLSDSLIRLREESSELMERIESFTAERREVLAKMEVLQAENARLLEQTETLREQQTSLKALRDTESVRSEQLADRLATAELDRQELRTVVAELHSNRLQIRDELNTTAGGEQMAIEVVEFSAEVYEKSMRGLEALLESYRRGRDKNAKFEVSKKLAKETRNTVDLLQALVAQHGDLVLKVNELQAQLRTAAASGQDNRQLDAMQLELATTESALHKLRDSVSNQNAELDALREQLASEQAAREALQAAASESVSELGGLHAQLTAAQDDRQSAEAEREILKKLVAEQKDQLVDTITEFQDTVDTQCTEIDQLQQQIVQLNGQQQKSKENYAYMDELRDKMIALKQLFDENNEQLELQSAELQRNRETIAELQQRLSLASRGDAEAADQLAAKEDELSYLQEIVDATRLEMSAVQRRCTESDAERDRLHGQVEELLQQVQQLQNKSQAAASLTDELRSARTELAELEVRNREQLEKLKKFAANLKKKNAQCAELQQKCDSLETPGPLKSDPATDDQLDRLRQEVADLQRAREQVDTANAGLREQIAKLRDELLVGQEIADQQAAEQQAAHQHLRDSVLASQTELSAKCVELDAGRQLIESQIAEHATKENELAIQTAALVACQAQLAEKCDRFDALHAQLGQHTDQLASSAGQLEELRVKIEKCKQIIREKNRELKRLQQELELQPPQADSSALSLKLAEHERSIETLHEEKAAMQAQRDNLQERLANLEVSAAEAEQLSAQRFEELLGLRQQAQDAATAYTAKLQSADERLLAAEASLHELRGERDELAASLAERTDALQAESQRTNASATRCASLEAQLAQLSEDGGRLTAECSHLQETLRRNAAEASATLAAKHAEIDTLENELSAQLQQLNSDRRAAQADLDRTREANAELLAETARLKEIIASLEQTSSDLERDCGWLRLQNEGMQQDQLEAQELRMQVVHDQTELENVQAAHQQLATAHAEEVSALRQQLAELDSLRTQIGQNQTDDQMCVQHENERLQARLLTLEAEVAGQQRRIVELQMAPPVVASAAELGAAGSSNSTSDSEKLQLSERVHELRGRLERSAQELHDKCAELARSDDRVRELQEIVQRIAETAEPQVAVVEPVVVVAQPAQQEQQAGPVQPPNPTPSATDVTHLEQYINDLQIQLRIATNDCEQLAATQQALELEIQQRSVGYEQQIAQLRGQLEQQPQPLQQQVVQQSLAQKEEQQQTTAPSVEGSILASIESQIIPSTAAAVPAFDGAMFFGHTTAASFPELQSAGAGGSTGEAEVREPPIVPKTAYICVDGGDADDGWGFGADDAVLEEQHQQQQQQQQQPSQSTTNPMRDALQQQIVDMQTELERLRTDNTALQLKSAKMLKKLKEYKARNDELAAARPTATTGTSGSSDLDAAIQEELHSQIRALELRLKETRAEAEVAQQERQSLVRRVDVLTAANDRLTEMKERQDNDMESCRLRQRQLQQQLDAMNEWDGGDGGEKIAAQPQPPAADSSAQAQAAGASAAEELHQLKAQLEDVQGDNAELHACLEAEKESYAALEERSQRLSNSNAAAADQLAQTEHLSARLAESVATIDSLSADSAAIQQHLANLRAEHDVKLAENRSLAEEFASMATQFEALKSQLQLSRESASREPELAECAECERLLEAAQLRDSQMAHLTEQVNESVGGRRIAEQDLERARAECATLQRCVGELQSRQEELLQQLDVASEKSAAATAEAAAVQVAGNADETEHRQLVQDLQAQNTQLRAELHEAHIEKHSMEHELSVLNDQVLSTLHLEDEMQSVRRQLDDKTAEIAQHQAAIVRLTRELQVRTDELALNTAQLNAHWEMQVTQRCSELSEQWRVHLAAREDEFAAQLARHSHHDAIDETTQTQTLSVTASAGVTSVPPSPLATTGSRNTKAPVVEELQSALEAQELEIVTLKEQLAIRSAEYARLAAQVDPFGSGRTTGPTTAGTMATPIAAGAGRTPAAAAASSKNSELDLALYMLHQRDMRCEELTEELMSMLEERDQLQLKLGGTMRQIERLRVVAKDAGAQDVDIDLKSDSTPEKQPSNSPSADRRSDSTNPATSASASSPPSRQRALRTERDQRQRQMTILQRDVATLPAEAVAELMGPDYANAPPAASFGGASSSTSATSGAADESPYTALLNLFWGPRAPAPADS